MAKPKSPVLQYVHGPHDPLLAEVLRGHLLIEYQLNRMLLAARSKSRPKTVNGLGFRAKVSKVRSLDCLPPHFEKILVAINNIRNRYAHALHWESPDGDLHALGELVRHKSILQVLPLKDASGRWVKRESLWRGVIANVCTGIMFNAKNVEFWGAFGCEEDAAAPPTPPAPGARGQRPPR
jgi:hypothetical protein